LRIFARIFLGFWFATVLAIVVSLGSLLTVGADETSEFSRSLPVSELTQCADAVVKSYASGDAASTERLKHRCEIRFIVDSSGRDTAGQSIPRELAAPIRHVRATGDLVVDPLPQKTVVVFPAAGLPGQGYVVVFWRVDTESVFVRNLVGRIVAFSLVSAVICYLLTSYFLKPLTRLGVMAQSLGRADLSVRVDSALQNRRDEFGKLARIFNGMADRIQVLIANEKRFLAHVSHELGSPLTRLNIALALARRKGGPEMLPELERIGKEANQLNGLIQQLLLLARLQSGHELTREAGDFQIADVVAEVTGDADFEARQMDRAVVVTRMENFTVKGYRDLLRSALDNVVRNALRFTREGCPVEIEFFRTADRKSGIIRVRDQGPGVDATKVEAIFEAFVSSEVSGKRPGAGLGLAIARQAVGAHGGIISARNLDQGGLLIEIELPLAE
jgi:two-component system sensor histidine kinase CpxA